VPSESAGISIEIPASQGENAEASTAVISQPMTTSSADGARIAVPNRLSFELFGSTLFDCSSADIDASRRRHEYCAVATTLQNLTRQVDCDTGKPSKRHIAACILSFVVYSEIDINNIDMTANSAAIALKDLVRWT
jgi:hypothetical protein